MPNRYHKLENPNTKILENNSHALKFMILWFWFTKKQDNKQKILWYKNRNKIQNALYHRKVGSHKESCAR